MNGPTDSIEVTERSVLGSMLLTKTACDDVIAVLEPSDLHNPAHEVIYETIRSLHMAGSPVDPLTVGDALTERGLLRRCGGMSYLHEMVASVAATGNAGYHAQILSEQAALRRLATAGQQITHLAQSGEGSLDEIIAKSESALAQVVNSHAGQETDGVDEALNSLSYRTFIRTPWRELNHAIGGWTPGWLFVFGARPGIGKTQVGINVMLEAALQRGWASVFFSMEMPRDQLILRALSNIGQVDSGRIMQRGLTTQDEESMKEAAEAYRHLPIFIDDRSALTLAQMRARVRDMKRKHDNVLVIVDYLTLIRPSSGSTDRRVQVDEIAQGLKELARDLNVPVVALAQLNREIEGRAVKMPTLRDLRESGGIEAAADVVALLHRETLAQLGDPRRLQVIVAKNRHGMQVQFELLFRGQYAQIVDWPTLEEQRRLGITTWSDQTVAEGPPRAGGLVG